jgi:glycine cleavage system H protein
MYPPDLKYTKEHEWVRVANGESQVGITDYAQQQLGDVVYVELPEVGQTFRKGDVFGSIESVKAASELFCPVSGEVTRVNTDLADRPEAVNKDPHGTWMIMLTLSNPEETGDLLDHERYAELVKAES